MTTATIYRINENEQYNVASSNHNSILIIKKKVGRRFVQEWKWDGANLDTVYLLRRGTVPTTVVTDLIESDFEVDKYGWPLCSSLV